MKTPYGENSKTSEEAIGQTSAEADSDITREEETTIDLTKLRVGTVITHKMFGDGKITKFRLGKMLISFEKKTGTFLIPDVFERGHLTIKEL